MNLPYRIDLLSHLGAYILENGPDWQRVKEKASWENGWFIPEFIELATGNIARFFLQKALLQAWTQKYPIPESLNQGSHPSRQVGIVMAGNIPLVGFHDFLCVFISGNKALIKTSSKDETLIKHLVDKLGEWDASVKNLVEFAPLLKGCDAYIATGSNNSSPYFDYYFGKYPHIIRRNKTSVALLTGEETGEELIRLANDVFLYFGLGCRNVTKIYVPIGYDFIPLLNAFKKYDYLADHHKYKNNYDYNLAILILNKKYYMSTPALIMVEEASIFSPISLLNFEYYQETDKLTASLKARPDLQCIVGKGFIAFGESQSPRVEDYADGIDTLEFVSNL